MKHVVAVDLDGTLADLSDGWKSIDHFGDPIPGAVEFTRELSRFADVVIHTYRTNPELNKGVSVEFSRRRICEWLDQHGFAYADIWCGQGKPVATCYVDDRAIFCAGQPDHYRMALAEVREACGADED